MKCAIIAALLLGGIAVSVAAEEVKTELYTVVDGFYVDKNTMDGFRTWRAAACDRCHGANQEGMVGPSLIQSMQIITKDQFVATITEGRLEKGMPAWGKSMSPMNVKEVTFYVMSLQGTNPPDAKAPQGELFKPEPIEADTLQTVPAEAQALQ